MRHNRVLSCTKAHFAHLYVCSTSIAKMRSSPYQFPCNHLQPKVYNLVRSKVTRTGNFYLLLRNLSPELVRLRV